MTERQVPRSRLDGMTREKMPSDLRNHAIITSDTWVEGQRKVTKGMANGNLRIGLFGSEGCNFGARSARKFENSSARERKSALEITSCRGLCTLLFAHTMVHLHAARPIAKVELTSTSSLIVNWLVNVC